MAHHFYSNLLQTGMILALASTSSWAGNLTITPAASIAYDHTDNLTLTNSNEVSDNIVTVTPAVEAVYQGNKLTVDVQYQLESLYYSKNSSNDENYQQLNSLVTAELLNDLFWLNFSNNIAQRSISETADQQQDNIFATGNTTDVKDHILQPVLRFRNHDINYEFNASLAQQRFDNDDAVINQQNNDTESYNASISSDNNSRFNWGVNYSSSNTEFTDSTDNQISNTEAFLNIALNSHISSILTVGQDDNDFNSISTDTLDNEYWSASITWNPNNRLNLLIRGGERFNSSDNGLAINYQGHKLNLTINSDRELISNGINTQTVFDGTQVTQAPLSNDVLLRELNSISIGFTQSKLQLNITYTHDDRESQLIASQNETDESIDTDINWQLQSRTRLFINHSKTDDEVPGAIPANNRVDKVTINRIGLNRQLSPDSELALLIRSQKRKSNNNTFNYNERGYQLRFSHRF